MRNRYIYTFDFKWETDRLLSFYKEQKALGMTQIEKGKFEVVDVVTLQQHLPTLPLFDVMQLPQIRNNCMLGEITERIGLHCNPGNNGLVILPLEGSIDLNFYSMEPPIKNGLTSFLPGDTTYEVEKTLNYIVRGIDTPFAFNGRWIHDYWPAGHSAIFYALKIPLGYEWTTTQECLYRA